MKRTHLLVITAVLALAGCKDKSKPAAAADTNASGGSVLTAPVDYLDAVGKAQQRAVGTIDTTSLTQAIQMFYTDKGRYPKDLNELVNEKYITHLPETPYGTKFEYDASDGTVKVVKQ